MKDDMISRQAALDALGERPVVWSDNDDYTLGERNQYDMDRLAIETVPSARLAQDLPNTCTDAIGRQAAIDAMIKLQTEDIEAYGASIPEGFDGDRAVAVLKALPSAQPELSPCDVCRYYPPSSMDGKPCTICPAERKNDE